MARNRFRGAVCSVFFAAVAPVMLAQQGSVQDESFFREKLYPLMHEVQCNLCHNDNGVASVTRLQFPSPEATDDQITALGLKLIDLVDRQDPQQSILLLKPTNRMDHTGGERITPGSPEEEVLLTWINYLAGLSEEQVRLAQEKIGRAQRLSLHDLTLRRLTHSQYNSTVRDLIGDQSRPADGFPGEDFVHGFKNQPEGQGVPPLQAEEYSSAAERLARNTFRGGDHQGLIPCEPASAQDLDCASQFVKQFGLTPHFRFDLDIATSPGPAASLLIGVPA